MSIICNICSRVIQTPQALTIPCGHVFDTNCIYSNAMTVLFVRSLVLYPMFGPFTLRKLTPMTMWHHYKTN
ncbi:hypothetical protein BD770DRAFT_169372 [Pilaira anomala]|nr:hypothetical protein BD770DRAFT_169372 [Pilaira anomala]